MVQTSFTRSVSQSLLLSILLLPACGPEQKVGQNVDVKPIINVTVPGTAAAAVAPTAPAAAASVPPVTAASPGVAAPAIDDDNLITQVLKDNVNALNAANQSAYQATFDPSSPLSSAALTVLQASVQFGVKQEVVSVNVSSKSTTSATVILTRRVSSPVTGTQTERVLCGLNKVNSSWKISTMTIQSSDSGFM